MKKRAVMALLFLAVIVGGLVPATSYAQASVQTFRNIVTGRCLDSNNTFVNGAFQAYVLACNGGDNQKWIVQASGTSSNGNRIRVFVNYKTGLCLDGDTTRVYTLPCNGGNFQRWEIFTRDNGIKFRSMATLLCLTDRSGLTVRACDSNFDQRWN